MYEQHRIASFSFFMNKFKGRIKYPDWCIYYKLVCVILLTRSAAKIMMNIMLLDNVGC